MTILEALSYGEARLKARFKNAGHYSPRIDAQVLLASARKKTTSYLFAHMDEELPLETERLYRETIDRRANFEPVAYLTGHKAFFGREFHVTKATLIPRPETELLVEEVLKQIDARPLLVDIGTGSGAIAITLALESNRPVLAFDISKDALLVARKNATNLKAESLVHFAEGDLLEPLLKDHVPYTDFSSLLVCANLPYIPNGQYESLDADVRLFEPKLALTGGIDGLDLYHRLLEQIEKNDALLPRKKTLLFEIDPSQPALVTALANSFSYEVTLLPDLSGKPRLAILRTP